MDEAKIQFSPAEMELMNNAGIILTKNRVLQKIKHLLEGIQEEMVHRAYREPDLISSEIFQASPKISKGENYQGLPYLVLDYPRHFDSVNIFAIRTLFWWGHTFSSTLHLAGDQKEAFLPLIEEGFDLLKEQHYSIGLNEDPWQHHFEEDNYRSIADMDKDSFIHYCRQYDHLKIAKQWPLWDAHFVNEDLVESWRLFLKLCFP
jgi:hypothetical protein